MDVADLGSLKIWYEFINIDFIVYIFLNVATLFFCDYNRPRSARKCFPSILRALRQCIYVLRCCLGLLGRAKRTYFRARRAKAAELSPNSDSMATFTGRAEL